MAEEKKTDKKNKIDVDKSETIKQNEKKSSKKTSEKNEDVKDTTLSESSDEKIDKKNEKKRKKQEEIKEKFIEYQKTKDKALRDELIEEHIYLAEILAKKYTGRGIDYEDIFQVASVGLILAVDRFDPSKGGVFYTSPSPRDRG